MDCELYLSLLTYVCRALEFEVIHIILLILSFIATERQNDRKVVRHHTTVQTSQQIFPNKSKSYFFSSAKLDAFGEIIFLYFKDLEPDLNQDAASLQKGEITLRVPIKLKGSQKVLALHSKIPCVCMPSLFSCRTNTFNSWGPDFTIFVFARASTICTGPK